MPASTPSSKRVALAPINVNVASPLQNFKSRQTQSFHSGLSAVSNAMSSMPALAPKFSLAKSLSTLAPTCARDTALPARKMESFSEYKITNSRNVKADLAATKLKLRLQMAFYKLKSARDASVAHSPNIRVSKDRKVLSLSSASQISRTHSFTRSANVNLQKPRAAKSGPRLSAIASQKSEAAINKIISENGKGADTAATTAPSMKLYHIKPSSAFYNTYSQRLPLTDSHQQRLPSVHKILRTPIKAASKAMSQRGKHSQAANFSAGTESHSDETIDETADENNADFTKKRGDILGSSPLRHGSFGTPNSFSVAKSLLQLGSGFY